MKTEIELDLDGMHDIENLKPVYGALQSFYQVKTVHPEAGVLLKVFGN